MTTRIAKAAAPKAAPKAPRKAAAPAAPAKALPAPTLPTGHRVFGTLIKTDKAGLIGQAREFGQRALDASILQAVPVYVLATAHKVPKQDLAASIGVVPSQVTKLVRLGRLLLAMLPDATIEDARRARVILGYWQSDSALLKATGIDPEHQRGAALVTAVRKAAEMTKEQRKASTEKAKTDAAKAKKAGPVVKIPATDATRLHAVATVLAAVKATGRPTDAMLADLSAISAHVERILAAYRVTLDQLAKASAAEEEAKTA